MSFSRDSKLNCWHNYKCRVKARWHAVQLRCQSLAQTQEPRALLCAQRGNCALQNCMWAIALWTPLAFIAMGLRPLLASIALFAMGLRPLLAPQPFWFAMDLRSLLASETRLFAMGLRPLLASETRLFVMGLRQLLAPILSTLNCHLWIPLSVEA